MNALRCFLITAALALLPDVTEKLAQVTTSVATLEDQAPEGEIAQPVDLEVLRPELERLRALLEDDDSEASELMEDLQSGLFEEYYPAFKARV